MAESAIINTQTTNRSRKKGHDELKSDLDRKRRLTKHRRAEQPGSSQEGNGLRRRLDQKSCLFSWKIPSPIGAREGLRDVCVSVAGRACSAHRIAPPPLLMNQSSWVQGSLFFLLRIGCQIRVPLLV
jgi:hypothetical protein